MAMKYIFAFLLSLTVLPTFAGSMLAEGIYEKRSLTELEERFLEIARPYAHRVGVTNVVIAEDFENTLYTGGVQIIDKTAVITFGIDFRSAYLSFSDDAYAKILCHELGHVVGETQNPVKPISEEAESDYFAGAVCLKKLFRTYPKSDGLKPVPVAVAKCRVSKEPELCERVAMAGVDFFSSLHHSLRRLRVITEADRFYALPDLRIEDSGFYTFYPSLQCRAETVAAGAFCETSEKAFDKGQRDWHCQRPRCWYP